MTTPVLLVSLAPTFIIGVVFLLIPRVREGILFGVSVPVDFADSEEGLRILDGYRTRILVALFAVMIASGACVLGAKPALLTVVTIAALPLFGWAWVRAWRQTRPFAFKAPLRRSASLAPARGMDGFSLSQFAALLPLVCAAVYLQLHWLQIPPRFAVHWGVDGVANGWSTRTLSGVFGPLALGALIVGGLAVLTWGVSRMQPEQAKQMRPILAVMSWLMSALFTATALHPLVANPDAGPRFISWIVIAGMVALGVTLSYVFHLPHRGSAFAWDGTPDSGWRWGLVYYNPADSAVIVKNRFGLGWTLNFASAQAKLWCGGTLLFTAIVIIVVLTSVHS